MLRECRGAESMSRPCATWPIFDDDQDTVRTRACFPKVAGHPVTIWNDRTKDGGGLATRLQAPEALARILEHTLIPRALRVWADKMIQCVYGDMACFCFRQGPSSRNVFSVISTVTAQGKTSCQRHSVSVLRKHSGYSPGVHACTVGQTARLCSAGLEPTYRAPARPHWPQCFRSWTQTRAIRGLCDHLEIGCGSSRASRQRLTNYWRQSMAGLQNALIR